MDGEQQDDGEGSAAGKKQSVRTWSVAYWTTLHYKLDLMFAGPWSKQNLSLDRRRYRFFAAATFTAIVTRLSPSHDPPPRAKQGNGPAPSPDQEASTMPAPTSTDINTARCTKGILPT